MTYSHNDGSGHVRWLHLFRKCCEDLLRTRPMSQNQWPRNNETNMFSWRKEKCFTYIVMLVGYHMHICIIFIPWHCSTLHYLASHYTVISNQIIRYHIISYHIIIIIFPVENGLRMPAPISRESKKSIDKHLLHLSAAKRYRSRHRFHPASMGSSPPGPKGLSPSSASISFASLRRRQLDEPSKSDGSCISMLM